MPIYNSTYAWEGWGGKLQLASGKCRLRIYDRSEETDNDIPFLKPFIVIVSDLPDSKMTVKSCAGHIATKVTQDFNIGPHRMFWVEYYPLVTYGANFENFIPEQYVAVNFEWHKEKAINPKWRQLKPPLLDIVKSLIKK